CAAGAEAKVDIVVVDLETRVEAAKLVPDGSSNGQACASDRGDLAGDAQPRPPWGRGLPASQVRRIGAAAHRDARVLDGVVGIEQQAAGDANPVVFEGAQKRAHPGG